MPFDLQAGPRKDHERVDAGALFRVRRSDPCWRGRELGRRASFFTKRDACWCSARSENVRTQDSGAIAPEDSGRIHGGRGVAATAAALRRNATTAEHPGAAFYAGFRAKRRTTVSGSTANATILAAARARDSERTCAEGFQSGVGVEGLVWGAAHAAVQSHNFTVADTVETSVNSARVWRERKRIRRVLHAVDAGAGIARRTEEADQSVPGE